MTTLNFSLYFKKLKSHGFSDSLINREKRSYQKCLKNLAKIKYTVFDAEYNDLATIETIDCDFGNVYRWISGQEPVDGIRISEVAIKSGSLASVIVEKAFYRSFKGEYDYFAGVRISLIKIKGIWKIDNISW